MTKIMLYTCSYNIYVKVRVDKRPKIPKNGQKLKLRGGGGGGGGSKIQNPR